MAFPHIKTDRPIPAERPMRQLKHAQSRNRKENSQPSWDGMESVRREMRNRRRHVDERQNTKTSKRYEH
jgi:hypothetical protein